MFDKKQQEIMQQEFRVSSDGVNSLTLESGVSRYIDGIFVGYDENGVFQQRNYSAHAEMVRDLDKEVQLNDGYSYWKLTGRTVVTWASGEVTYFIRKDAYTYSNEVIDLGYDESLPF